MYEYPLISAVHRREATLLKIMEMPKKIRREFDSRTTIDFDVLMMGKKIIRQTNSPIRAHNAITNTMDMRGLMPFNV
jgi:hypothetical protein